MAKKGFRCSLYCMQVVMCAMGFWLLVSNVFLYVMFPSGDDYKFTSESDDNYAKAAVNNFFSTAKMLNWPVFLADVDVLSDLSFKWSSLVAESKELKILHIGVMSQLNCDSMMTELQQFTCIYGGHNVVLEPHVLEGRRSFYLKLIQFDWQPDIKPPYFLVNSFLWGWTAFEPFQLATSVRDGVELSMPTDVGQFVQMAKVNRFLHCNTTMAEQFYREYPEQKRLRDEPESVAFQRVVRNILDKTTTALTPLKIPFWISSGVCLSWFRQCGPIPYMIDVDIGVFIDDIPNDDFVSIISAMESVGFRLFMQLGQLNDSFELSFKLSGVKLDIFFFYKDSQHYWNGGTKVETGEKIKFLFPPFSLCWTTYLGIRVRIPCDSETYVVANYGPNWFHPVTKWEWNKSPPNVQPNGRWPTHLLNETIIVFE